MAQQLVYLAYRDTLAKESELARVGELTQAYWRDFPMSDRFGGPGTYLEDDGPVYAGALTIPEDASDDESVQYIEYWLTWLTDVTRALEGARWKVELDGAPLVWNEDTGWALYTGQS